MPSNGAVELSVGSLVLTSNGFAMVSAIQRHSVVLTNAVGEAEEVSFTQLRVRAADGEQVQGVHASLLPWWDQLPKAARAAALFKQECVLEARTGFRFGLPGLAQPGEPFHPFGPTHDLSLAQRYEAMSKVISFERSTNRTLMRRVYDGEITSVAVRTRTLQRWDELWTKHGLRGLVDARSLRGGRGFEALDPAFRRIAQEIFAEFDGGISQVNLQEIERRILVRLKQESVQDPHLPQRLTQEYLSHHWRALGTTTRAHRSRSLRKVAGHESYPAQHPGHLATDLTRANNLVFDDLLERPISVEVGLITSVATRVICGIRVFPMSANGVDAGLLLYDAMRQFSMVVEGTTIDDFRWAGLPPSLDLSGNPTHIGSRPVAKPDLTLEGVHVMPGVSPSSIRCDHGSIFVGEHFRALLAQFGIDLMLSRGKKPTDNPHSERKMEDLERAYQQIPGYKGRAVHQRGTLVGIDADQPLLTAAQLETHLKRWVALDYHRQPHDGLALPGAPGARLTPLEMFDALSEATGRILVPQHPDLIFQFLPIRWLTVGHAGVEYRNLVYDAPVLEEFRDVRPGSFRDKDAAMPFHYDPRDVTRLWLRHPESDRVHEIEWKGRHLVQAPLVDVVRERALTRIRDRGGNDALSKKIVMRQLIDEIGQLTTAPDTDEWRAKLAAARVRWDQAQRDHGEVTAAHVLIEDAAAQGLPCIGATNPVEEDAQPLDLELAWPDYTQDAG